MARKHKTNLLHISHRRLRHIRKVHAVAQLSYLATELCGLHPIMCIFILAGGVLVLICGSEPLEIGV